MRLPSRGDAGGRFPSAPASGMVASAATAMAIIALTQPNALISAWLSGANTNWPKLPPALMKPAAKARFSAGSASGGGADQDGEAAGPGAGRCQHPKRQEQHPRARNERRERAARRKQDGAGNDHAGRAVLVGDRAEDRLRDAPDELSHGQGEADGDDAQARSTS